MTPQEVIESVQGLNELYPNGWRSGDPTCDALTVYLFHSGRQMSKILFGPRKNDGY